MSKVVSDCRPVEYAVPPFIGWNVLFQSSSARKPLWTPFIWTKTETFWPCAFVIAHVGPGETQPVGVVDDGVSHLFALSGPYGDVIPGLKMLPFLDAPPSGLVWFPRICSTDTVIGVQLTFGFHDEPVLGEVFVVAPEVTTKGCTETSRIKTRHEQTTAGSDLRL